MRSTITLNGIESTEIEGLLIQSLPPISKPLMRTQIEEIDGRDGDQVTNLGFSAYTKEFKIGLYGDFDINQVIAYFNSKGIVTFSNEPDKYYNYQIIGQIDFERLIRFRTATVSMHCQPFKYSTTEGADILSSSDNFATLDQSINTDSQYFTYTSNVQDDVTATRNSVATGSKFFATYTMSVVQGITYHFSGTSSNNVTMYGYKDNIWGTSAGFSGRKLAVFKQYTATYTGTLIIGFYGNGTDPLYIRNFYATNEAGSTISGEGNNIVLQNTSEAPFSQLDLKGDTSQITYSGAQLLKKQGMATPKADSDFWQTFSNNITQSSKDNGWATLTITSTASYSMFSTKAASSDLLTETTYTAIVEIKDSSITTGGIVLSQSYNASDPVSTYTIVAGCTASGGGVITAELNGSSTVQYNVYVFTTKSSFNNGLRYYFNGSVGLGSVDVRATILAGDHSTDWQNYCGDNWQPYVGSTSTQITPSPNPDYPQDVNVVAGAQTVKIHGKNLFDKSEPNILTAYIDGTHTTITSNNKNRIIWIPCKPNQTYTIQKIATDMQKQVAYTTIEPAIGVTVYGMANWDANTSSKTYTTGADAKYLVVRIYQSDLDAAYTLDQMLASVQIEEGSTATAYETYQGQRYLVGLYGKNMFNKAEALTYKWLNASTGKLQDSSDPNVVTPYIGVEVGKKYTFSGIGNLQIRVFGYANLTDNKLVTYIDLKRDQRTFTSQYPYMRASIGGGDAAAVLNDIQVEQGDTATSFEPYTPLELCKIGDYQDYFYKDGDDWYLHKEVKKQVLDGSESGWGTQNNVFRTDFADAAQGEILEEVLVISDHFVGETTRYRGDVTNLACAKIVGNNQQIGFRYDALLNDTTSWTTWLSNNNVTICYVLKTPTDTIITNSTLIEQLEAVSNAHSYKPITYINATSDGTNLPHIIAATTAGNMDGTITNSGNTTARPKLTLFGSGNIGIYLNGVQIFQIALGTEGYITIDTNAMEAYKDTTDNLKNRLVTGDYSNFVLKVGANQISFSGNTTMCAVENYSRWL